MELSRNWVTAHFLTFCGHLWNHHGPGVCYIEHILRLKVKWKLSLPSWTQLVLISFCPVLGLCQSLQGCALPFSCPSQTFLWDTEVKEVQEGLQGSQMHTGLKEWELSNPGLKNLRFGFGPWLVLYELISHYQNHLVNFIFSFINYTGVARDMEEENAHNCVFALYGALGYSASVDLGKC